MPALGCFLFFFGCCAVPRIRVVVFLLFCFALISIDAVDSAGLYRWRLFEMVDWLAAIGKTRHPDPWRHDHGVRLLIVGMPVHSSIPRFCSFWTSVFVPSLCSFPFLFRSFHGFHEFVRFPAILFSRFSIYFVHRFHSIVCWFNRSTIFIRPAFSLVLWLFGSARLIVSTISLVRSFDS